MGTVLLTADGVAPATSVPFPVTLPGGTSSKTVGFTVSGRTNLDQFGNHERACRHFYSSTFPN
jgi:hypothetical protein